MDPIEYRPRVAPSLAVAVVWFATAGVVAWLGLILGPEDRGAMDGFALLLFTVVPIRLFCWTMAPVLAALGVYLARRSLAGPPTLVLMSDGLVLRSGVLIQWGEITSAELASEGDLVIGVESLEPARGSGVWSLLKRLVSPRRGQTLAFSPFELGSRAEDVVAELKRRMATDSRR